MARVSLQVSEVGLRSLAFTILILGGALTAACGPVVSGVSVLDASHALAEADAAGAKQNALYEYTAASEYLKKAREEAAYSDFIGSADFADKALKFALDAKSKAMATPPAVVPTAPSPVVEPSQAPTQVPVVAPTPRP